MMAIRVLAAVTLAALCFPAAGLHAQEADYSKCAAFFNDPPGEDYKVKMRGPFLPNRSRGIPFDIRGDGSIELHSDEVLSTETSRVNEREGDGHLPQVAVHELLESMDPNILEGAAMRTAKVVITRDANGDISEIVEDQNLSAAELDALRASPRSDDRFFAYLATRTMFEVRNGQCVPVQSREVLMRETGEGDRQTETTTYDTKLCRRAREFMIGHPELERFHNKEIGEEAAGLLGGSVADVIRTKPGSVRFMTDQEYAELVTQAVDSRSTSQYLTLQLLTGALSAEKVSRLDQELLGVSPMISLLMVQANCYYQNLRPFFNDQSIWTP